MEVYSLEPLWGVNYKPGYIGFSYHVGNAVSLGISWFTRWRRREITVTHAFVVVSEVQCVEAHIGVGVVRSDLTQYFSSPRYRVFFRKPVGWTPELGERIAAAASARVGSGYATTLILAHAAVNTLVGRGINWLCGGWLERWLARRLKSGKAVICSELAALSLAEQPEFARRGILKRPCETIDPQELFEDDELFEQWKEMSGQSQPFSSN